MSRIAFVIPWFGADLKGGAEQQAWQVATRLAHRGHMVDVLTTCCRSFQDDWATDALPAGASHEAGVTVRRFPVASRHRALFDLANAELLARNDEPKLPGVCPVSPSAATNFVSENIHSPTMMRTLESSAGAYAAVVFLPYLYGPTLEGLPRVADRAYLQPCLHDETYAYLPAVEAVFRRARGLLFISRGEQELAVRLFGPSVYAKGFITGGGVECGEGGGSNGVSGELPFDVRAPFLLYLGRRDATKNTPLLLRAFGAFRHANPRTSLSLVLAGPGELPPGIGRDGIVDRGLVSETEKSHLLARCVAVVQPSKNESFSRAIMEGWFHGRPALVHRECLATRCAVDACRGGWTAASDEEWTEAIGAMATRDASEVAAAGARGQAYAREVASWDKVIDRYEEHLGLRRESRPRRKQRVPSRLKGIHQLLPNLAYGDAISNQALFFRDCLRALGYESNIFVRHLDERVTREATPFTKGAIARDNGLIYHHSIGSEITAHAIAHVGPKILVYHNITPASFFERWAPDFAKLLETGRRDLDALASHFPLSAGDSAFNAADLRAAGFANPCVLPIAVSPMRWDFEADPTWMRMLQDGATNLLFVGRVAPNKCQHHLLECFSEYLKLDPRARLVVVGKFDVASRYTQFLMAEADRMGIASKVIFAGDLDESRLHACYRTAHLFLSMSEHEGFCVPLVEAMWFDVPVLAYSTGAVAETLGDAGLLFTEKRWPEIAALASITVRDESLRHKIIERQRIRRRAFLPEVVVPRLVQLVSQLSSPRWERGLRASIVTA